MFKKDVAVLDIGSMASRPGKDTTSVPLWVPVITTWKMARTAIRANS